MLTLNIHMDSVKTVHFGGTWFLFQILSLSLCVSVFFYAEFQRYLDIRLVIKFLHLDDSIQNSNSV